MPPVDELPLRQCVLAVCVLSDLDLSPSDAGVLLLTGPEAVLIEWSTIRDAVGGHPPDGAIARRRVETLVRLHRLAIELGSEAEQRFRSAARVVALPPEHSEHLGAGWIQEPLRGDALDLGIGVQGLLSGPDRTSPLPPSVLRALGVSGEEWWPGLREHVERMGALSAARLARDGSTGLIRPVGGCDVLALLSSRTLRKHLAEGDGSGLRGLAVPTRRRGWYDVTRVDPAFVRVAWSLTDEHERGLAMPVLVTADDVTIPFSLA